MLKKKYIFTTLMFIAMVVMTLTSCDNKSSVSSSTTSVSSSNSSGSVVEIDTTPIPENKAANSPYALDFDSIQFTPSSTPENGKNYYTPENYNFTYRDYRMLTSYLDPQTVGNQRILVIPVKFEDERSSVCRNLKGGCDKARADIEKVFFGDPKYTGWESVSSYYYKSSYGKLKLQGRVSDWFTLDLTTSELSKLPRNQYADPTFYVLRRAAMWYQQTYGDLNYFDQDKDNYVDAIWLVYDRSYLRTTSNNVWWAYTYWDFQNNASGIKPYTYAWASLKFLYEGNYYDGNNSALVDAHTFIHETGHILGLEDYYSYDGNEGPAGRLDMMDYNIGDHNAYSKMILGWTKPKVITGNTTITINPFESSGDCILVRDSSWNKTALDEYLLIEFYTPTGLNYLDSRTAYSSGTILFTIPGIKIYHIDSRLAEFGYTYAEGYSFIQFTDSLESTSDQVMLACSNTPSSSIAKEFSLVHLIEANGTNSFQYGNCATNDTLFKNGDLFTPSKYSNFFTYGTQFNDYTSIGYSISVDNLTSTSATLTFTTL